MVPAGGRQTPSPPPNAILYARTIYLQHITAHKVPLQ